MLYTLAKVLNVLNSEADPSQISLAVALALVAGLTPLMSLHNLVVLLLVLVLRVNLSAFLLGLAIFSGLAGVSFRPALSWSRALPALGQASGRALDSHVQHAHLQDREVQQHDRHGQPRCLARSVFACVLPRQGGHCAVSRAFSRMDEEDETCAGYLGEHLL